ncbi:DUF554 domain-containing protein [Kytococcus sedentarius]|uniref:DUF554 domain-containing protein n=1 Tax=Kytococcus sedentarius TaxID=1276 RepID=UPI0035BC6C86
MDGLFPGAGTLLNVLAVLAGSSAGIAFGARLPQRIHDVVTDGLGLVTLMMAGLSVVAVTSSELEAAVGEGIPVLLVLGALLIGGVTGSALEIERRMEGMAGWLQRRLVRRGVQDVLAVPDQMAPGREGGTAGEASPEATPQERFVQGWTSASLLFCVGPLTVLGSLSDGLGLGIEQLALKSALDFFAALAFASAFGVGVVFSAVSVLVVQGLLTLVGLLAGEVVPMYAVDVMTAAGGLLLVGIAFGLLRVRTVPVGDLLPALLVAPVLAWLVTLA